MLRTTYQVIILASIAAASASVPLDFDLAARQVPVSFNSTSTTAPSSSATLNTTLGGVNGAGSGQSGTMTSGAQGGMQLYLSAGLVSVLIAGVVLL